MALTRSALPPSYFAIFGIYEPLLTAMGFIGALMDPVKARNSTSSLYSIQLNSGRVSSLCIYVYIDTQYAGSVALSHPATATFATRDEGHGRTARTRLRPSRPRQLLPPPVSTPVSIRTPRAAGESGRCLAHATPHRRRAPSRAHVLGSR